MPISEFTQRTGLSEHGIEELLAAGRLLKLENRAVAALFERPVLVRSVAEGFIEQLRSSVTPLGYDDDDCIQLASAFRAVGGRPKPYVALFDRAIKDRSGIRAPMTENGEVDLAKLYVSPLILHILGSLHSAFCGQAPVSRSVACEILNCDAADLDTLIVNRKLKLDGNGFSAASVIRASSTLVSLDEVNARLGFQERGAVAWLKRQGLHQVLPGFGDRNAVRQKLGAHIPLGAWRRTTLGLSIEEIKLGRGELTEREWDVVRGWLPRQRKSSNGICDRRVINAAIWISTTGCHWKDLPSRYGVGVSCYARFRQLRNTGAFERVIAVFEREVKRAASEDIGRFQV